MDDNLPPRLATMDRSTPRFRVHRGKHDTKADRAVAAGLGGDTEFAAAQVGMLGGTRRRKGKKKGGRSGACFHVKELLLARNVNT